MPRPKRLGKETVLQIVALLLIGIQVLPIFITSVVFGLYRRVGRLSLANRLASWVTSRIALTGAAGAVDFALIIKDLCAIYFNLSGNGGRYGFFLLSELVFISIQIGAHSPRYRIGASDIVMTVNRLIMHFICSPETRVREVCIFLVSCLSSLL